MPYANEYKTNTPTFSTDVVDVKKQDQDIVSRLMSSFHCGLVRGKLPWEEILLGSLKWNSDIREVNALFLPIHYVCTRRCKRI